MEIKRIDRLISKHLSWDDLYKELGSNKKFTQKFKGDVFERLTQAYLLTMPEYQSILSNVWLNEEVPRNLLKKLNLPSEDFGVDLIARTNRNQYWTIQCKFKSTDSALTYKELSTFSTLSFVNAKNISLGLVSHSSNKPIRNRKFLGNISEIGLDRWLNLTNDEWKNIRKLCQHKAVKLVKRKPRSHQKKAINLSQKYFVDDKKSKGKLIMPCATGKSLTAFWIAQAIDAKKIIVAVPSLNLVKQSLNDWTKGYLAHGITPDWLCICSDQSAGKVEIDEFNTDTYDLGIPTTTNKEEIVNFLKRRSKNPKVIFTTYQSSPRLAESARAAKVSFEFAILDEAHKTVGMKDKSFSTLLFDQKIKIKKRLFMTATERVLRGRKDEVVSMNDPKVYGEHIYSMTFKDAIDQDIISDYKILTMAVSDNEVNSLIEDNRYITKNNSDAESSAQYFASGIALKKTFKKYKIKHAISFHRSIKLAKQFQEQQEELNEIKSLRPIVQNLHISSKKTSGQRVELIKEFTEQNRSLLTNARCLTEGVDVPAIDCVMFVDPKQSFVDIVQAAGRALRKFDGKDFGYILLPIVVPDNSSLEEFTDTTAFKKIISIIAALSSQDERIIDEFRMKEKGRNSSGKIINIDSHLKLSKSIDVRKFANLIETKIWEKVGKINYRDFEEARDYVRSLKLVSREKWEKIKYSLPPDIPLTPHYVYKNKGWKSFGDWVGTFSVATQLREYKEFEVARKFVRKLELKNALEWNKFCNSGNLPSDIPRTPDQVYKNLGFITFGDWLGSKNISNVGRKYKTFKSARKYAQSLKLKSYREWMEYSKKHGFISGIPSNPRVVYKDKGYISINDWLGTKKKKNYRNFGKPYEQFSEAKNYAISLKLKKSQDWVKFTKHENFPDRIPKKPDLHYKDKGWHGFPDWLGYEPKRRKVIPRNFSNARIYARSLELKSKKDWIKHHEIKQLPKDITLHPFSTYKDQWKGWPDWLGYKAKASNFRKFKSFTDARKYAQSLKLKSNKDWIRLYKEKKLNEDLPRNPDVKYKNSGWNNWPDFLGK